MGYVEVSDLRYALPGGRVLFENLSFRVPHGRHVALVGANGVGKTTILRLLAGEDPPQQGRIHVDGRVGYMPQFIGSFGSETTVRDFLVKLSRADIRAADAELRRAEFIVQGPHGQKAQLRYADALAAWADAGGYEAEVLWQTCVSAALEKRLDDVAGRRLTSLSGGEQKRLAIEIFFRSDADVLLLDEPDNFLDIPGKQWLEATMNGCLKTILFVSHDRAVLANTAAAIVTLEGRTAWTHAGTFATYPEARARRLERIEEQQRRYKEEHARIVAQIREFKRRAAMNDAFASRARAAESKLGRFERTNAPRERPREQDIRIDLGGGRTGKIVLRAHDLSFAGVDPFDAEIWFGERVGVVGPNGSGKSHFLKLLAGEAIPHRGEWKLGARVNPSLFSQLHERPDIAGEASVLDLLTREGLEPGRAIARLKRYELDDVRSTPFSLLSGGQQARVQILLMELESPTMLLLDEPTDNLDIDSAEALEEALARYRGTIVAATHDRWLMARLDRFLVFDVDGSVKEALDPPYS